MMTQLPACVGAVVFSSCLFAQAPAPEAAATDAIPTFRSEVSLVKVDVQVSSASGVNVGDLNEADFVVYDEDQPQKILHFGREHEPLSMLLLLDISGSMTKSLSALATSARQALLRLHEGDKVALMVFSERTRLVQPYTDDFGVIREQIVDSMYKRTTGEGTMLNESIISAAQYVKANAPAGRRAILVVTDDQSLRFNATDDDVLRAADAANASVNGIVVGNLPAPVSSSRPIRKAQFNNPAMKPPSVYALARSTGGEAMESGDIGESFKKIVERIRTRYTLDYSPTSGEAGQYRRIRVALAPAASARYPGAVVQGRTGYYVAK